jgi:hypothetical protein
MRMPVAGHVGVVALVIGLASSIGSGYWLATRNWVPVDIPISLSKGHIRSGDFHLNVPGEYVASVALDEPQEIPVRRTCRFKCVGSCLMMAALLNVQTAIFRFTSTARTTRNAGIDRVLRIMG